MVAALILLAIGVWLGGHPSWLPSSLRSTFVASSNGSLVDEVMGDIQRDYYRRVTPSQLVDKGLQAAVASLSDPYSHYFDPTDYKSFLNQSDPHVSGIGVDVLQDPQGLKVIDVFPGYPAAKAGIQRGDLIVAVGSTSLAGRSDIFATGRITGRAGTPVTITVKPAAGGPEHQITMTRANVQVPVASGQVMTSHGTKIGYVQLTAFTSGSGAEVRQDVQKVRRQGARAIVLDLRENGGGLLDEGVKVASVFIPDGTVVSTAGRSQPRQVYMATGGAIPTSIPLVVLVDKGTASAAEIVTGALQDRGRAKVVGTRTYGKGVFQEIRELSNGGALDITVGEYFTPSGRNLGGGGVKQGVGVKPDIYAVDNPKSKRDEALDVALATVAADFR
jgi:carboxyl-terminal processing protease